MATADEYQREIKNKFARILDINEDEIKIEKRMEIPAYSPRVDVAVPPFAINEGHGNRYNLMLRQNHRFFERLKRRALNTDRLNLDKNPNPRCFIALEVENSTGNDAKHILGSIANASFLGKVGILVTMQPINCLERINDYIEYVARAEKIDDEFRNVVLIQKKDFDDVLNEFL